MKTSIAAVLALAFLAHPAWADKKLDDAIVKAEDQAQKGKPDEGVKTIQKVVASAPSVEGYLALARFQIKIGLVDDAAASTAKAVDAGATATPQLRAEALAFQADLGLGRGTGRQSMTIAQDAVKAAETATSLAALARVQAFSGELGPALQSADKAVKADASSAAAQLALSEAMLASGRAAEAVEAARKALTLDPKLNVARVAASAALRALGKPAEALVEARKATDIESKCGLCFAELGLAILVENKNNWGEAISQAQQGAFLSPKDPRVQFAVGQVFEAGGNHDQARNAYNIAGAPETGFAAVRQQAALNRYYEINEKYKPMEIDEDEAKLKAQGKNGPEAQKIAERRVGVVEAAKKLMADFPTAGTAYVNAARLLAGTKAYDDAVKAAAKGAELSPNSAEAFALLGTLYQYTDKIDEAVAAFKKATDLAPNNVVYRSTYGLYLGLAKRHNEGIEQLKKVVATPGYKDAAGWANLGYLYRGADPAQPEEAVKAYQKALELNQKDENILLGLGLAYSSLKKWDDAIATYNKVVEVTKSTPISGAAYISMAKAYVMKQDIPQAKAALGKAEAAGRQDASLADYISKAEKGGVVTQEQREAFEKAQAKYAELEAINDALRSNSPAVRKRALGDLARKAGAEAVGTLTYYVQSDKDYGVRKAAAQALGSLGGAARSACQTLRFITGAGLGCDAPIIATPQQVQDEIDCKELKKEAAAALSKIGC
jgi:tetratricopeptide (TPR) repeat protein